MRGGPPADTLVSSPSALPPLPSKPALVRPRHLRVWQPGRPHRDGAAQGAPTTHCCCCSALLPCAVPLRCPSAVPCHGCWLTGRLRLAPCRPRRGRVSRRAVPDAHGLAFVCCAPPQAEGPTDVVYFSPDHGGCWHKVQLPEAISIDNIRVDPKGAGSLFIVHGQVGLSCGRDGGSAGGQPQGRRQPRTTGSPGRPLFLARPGMAGFVRAVLH